MQTAEIDWQRVRRVLVVRLRSIGDTVLATPSLTALKKFLPEAKVDILLEDWVAPILTGFDDVDDVIETGETNSSRIAAARRIRRERYDVVFNLHGGTTATFFTFASGARHRVGFKQYQYAFLHSVLVRSPIDFWNRTTLHSVEQQLALLGSVGVPVSDDLRTKLIVTSEAEASIEEKLAFSLNRTKAYALVHPAAAFATKQWPVENFARVAEYFQAKGIETVAIAAKAERQLLEKLKELSATPVTIFSDLTLPEITALASKASIFVGNDSGIAHIAAAVRSPSVVIFGSSNRDHWRPWTDAAHEVVFNEGKSILGVKAETVLNAIDRVLKKERSDVISAS